MAFFLPFLRGGRVGGRMNCHFHGEKIVFRRGLLTVTFKGKKCFWDRLIWRTSWQVMWREWRSGHGLKVVWWTGCNSHLAGHYTLVMSMYMVFRDHHSDHSIFVTTLYLVFQAGLKHCLCFRHVTVFNNSRLPILLTIFSALYTIFNMSMLFFIPLWWVLWYKCSEDTIHCHSTLRLTILILVPRSR